MTENIKSYTITREKILEGVKQEIIERLNIDLEIKEIDEEVSLFGTGLGLDSVDALDLTSGIEKRFGITIDETNTAIFKSVNALTDYIINEKARV